MDNDWQAWVGRSEEKRERIAPWPREDPLGSTF